MVRPSIFAVLAKALFRSVKVALCFVLEAFQVVPDWNCYFNEKIINRLCPCRGGAVPSQSLEPVTDRVVRKKFGGESEEPKNRPKAELIKKNPSPSLLRA